MFCKQHNSTTWWTRAWFEIRSSENFKTSNCCPCFTIISGRYLCPCYLTHVRFIHIEWQLTRKRVFLRSMWPLNWILSIYIYLEAISLSFSRQYKRTLSFIISLVLSTELRAWRELTLLYRRWRPGSGTGSPSCVPTRSRAWRSWYAGTWSPPPQTHWYSAKRSSSK